jgi:hypothetical protein
MNSELASVYKLKLPSKREVRWSPILPEKAVVYDLIAARKRRQTNLKGGDVR